MQSVFVVTFGKNTLRDPRVVGVFSTMKKAKDACVQDFEAAKGARHAYVSSTDYEVTEYFVDCNR